MNEVALKRVCSLVTDPGPEEERVSVALEHIIGGTGRIGSDVELPRRRPAAGLAAVQPGDVLFGKLRPYLAKTLRVREPMFASTELLALRPKSDTDARWLHYLTMSDRLVRWAVATSDGSKMPRTSWSALGEYRITVPELREQRAIADFLDAETARLDALIEKKRRQQAVLLEHEEAVLLDRLGDWRNESDRTLRQYGATAVTGPFGTQLAASEYVSDGTPVINPTHIERGRFKPEEEITVSSQVAARLKRHRLFEGDIVLGRKGDVGRSAIVTSKEAGWICGSDSIALRTDKTRLVPEFLVRLMSIDLYRQQLQATSTGTTMANVNQATLLGLRLPALSISKQGDRLALAERAIAPHEALIMTLGRQIELLTEHQQALITAAVTGQLEVPGISAS